MPPLVSVSLGHTIPRPARARSVPIKGIKPPILLLTARGDSVAKVVALKVGADDSVTKPFDMLELMVRIKGLLRCVPAGTAQVFTVRINPRGCARYRRYTGRNPLDLPLWNFSSFVFHGPRKRHFSLVTRFCMTYGVRCRHSYTHS